MKFLMNHKSFQHKSLEIGSVNYAISDVDFLFIFNLKVMLKVILDAR